MNGKTTDKENQSQYHVKLTQKETPQKAFLSVPRVTRKDRQAPGLWSSCRCRVRTSLYRWAASVATVQQQSPPPPPAKGSETERQKDPIQNVVCQDTQPTFHIQCLQINTSVKKKAILQIQSVVAVVSKHPGGLGAIIKMGFRELEEPFGHICTHLSALCGQHLWGSARISCLFRGSI